ncbi:phosphate ABC transporter permease PstA [Gilvimarinus xylanilyticus]|uniref:Phosphate transport system permease protein PstA n=1 Tax=Gilvimarinus xylanilyticus TaxID=2944139 RepID=A0A9X2HW89_9GAMM|nr:phosphate ABC transporter permease PstA [Gilvimarinus xylanilyticus]MCP8897736.1 phosphate ABC transporter permease PstA [Gilvimarinus xylanilyticus]
MKTWLKSGAPWIWLNGGAVALCVVMVVGLIGLIAVRGFGHFWPADVLQTTIVDKSGEQHVILGERVRSETIPAAVARDGGYSLPEDVELVTRYLIKQGNRDVSGRDFNWYMETGMADWEYPENAMVIERREWGGFYGFPVALEQEGEVLFNSSEEGFWQALDEAVERSVELHDEITHIEKVDIGRINHELERIRLERRRMELDGADASALAEADAEFSARKAELDAQYRQVKAERDELYHQLERDTLVAEVASGTQVNIPLHNIVRVTRPNAMGVVGKMGQYLERFWEFLTDEPREANTEGGIFPAIFGTITMVLVMSIIVTPFGVLAAIYLREYAKQGPVLRLIRISVYNLAGVPSIVYGVFGLGFFVYFLGGSIDELFYPESLPAPTFGTPGLFWASLTLALLTLPVVIVSTEEGLSRIPTTIRQGSLALGATKSETLWKVVVPLATPAMMTGLILAIARAAGEVAPLMLVGVVKLAPSLPIDGNYPYLHLDQKIMHLGFHIYDVGFQSPNVEAARPLVYATALTLVLLIIVLNLTAIRIRNSLREKYRSASD